MNHGNEERTREQQLADLVATAKSLRVPMSHDPKDPEYLPVLAYRVRQAIEKREREIRSLSNLHERIERFSPESV